MQARTRHRWRARSTAAISIVRTHGGVRGPGVDYAYNTIHQARLCRVRRGGPITDLAAAYTVDSRLRAGRAHAGGRDCRNDAPRRNNLSNFFTYLIESGVGLVPSL
jgi:hypothetical protein